MRFLKHQKFISLKIATKISGYNPDYIGWLIRTGKIKGRKVYSGVSWKTTREAILSYKYRNEKIKILKVKDSLSKRAQRFISLKEAARISGYAPDYIGWLIRTGKIPGKKIYTGVSWQTTASAVKEYQRLLVQKRRVHRLPETGLELAKRVAAEIFGFNKKTSKTFNVGWRFSLAALIIFFLISGFAPIKFLQSSLISALNGEETKTVNFYSTLSSGDWQNPQNVQGPPDVLDNGGLNSFSEVNSAIYKTGPLSLVAEKFVSEEKTGTEEKTEEVTSTPDTSTSTDTGATEDILEQENIGEGQGDEGTGQEETIEQQETQPEEQQEEQQEAATSTPEATSTPPTQEEEVTSTWQGETTSTIQQEQNQGGVEGEAEGTEGTEENNGTEGSGEIGILERIKRFFGFEAQAQIQPEWIFQSAKIRFSFAIGEKEPDIIVEATKITEVSPRETQEVSFWGKAKNFFGKLVRRAILIVKAEENIPSTTPEALCNLEDCTDTLPGLDEKIIIWYSLDGENWQKLDTISESSLSNALNNGYFEYDAPFLKNDEDIKNLKIKFEGVVGGETNIVAYLDSVWVETTYKEQAAEEEEKGFELRALKKDWRADETPTFEVVPKGKTNFIEKIIDKASSIFQEPPKVEAELARPDNEELPLQEGEDFSTETHSPTKITVFRPEDFRPGLYKLNIDYEAKGKVYNLEEDFTWGVLAININKSIYLPNEQAFLQMAVLNEEGHTICDADLTLEITAPDGTKTIFTTGGQERVIEELEQVTTTTEEQAVTTTEPTITETTTTIETTSTPPLQEEEVTSTETISTETTTTEEATSTEIEATTTETITTEATSTPEESEIPPTSFWNKVKNFFGGLTNRIGESLACLRWNLKHFVTTLIVRAEETQKEAADTSFIDTVTSTQASPTDTTSTEPTFVATTTEATSTEATSTPSIQEATSTITTTEPVSGATTTEATSTATSTATGDSGDTWQEQEGEQEEEGTQEYLGDTYATNGVIYTRGSECGPNSVTNIPDYYTYYNVAGPGVYQIKLTAITKNGTHEITDQFEARESVPFDVERIGPTRIYPPATYEMRLIIKANEDFQGEVVESVPAGFEIVETSDKRQATKDVEKNIIWDADWKTGETYQLQYQFDAPDVSPYLYLLGPLKFEQQEASSEEQGIIDKIREVVEEKLDVSLFSLKERIGGVVGKIKEGIRDLFGGNSTEDGSLSAVFQEARQWQIAADSPGPGDVILLWDGATIPGGWTCISCTSTDAFYGVFPRASSTYAAATSGADTHTHTAATSSISAGASYVLVKSGSTLPSDSHTHSWAGFTTSADDHRPPFKNLKFIKATNPGTLPNGVIGIFDVASTSSLPANWTYYTALDGNYLRGNNTTSTGGTSTHTHTGGAQTSGASDNTVAQSTGDTYSGAAKNHTHTLPDGTTAAATNTPPFINVVFAQLTTTSSIPNGLIAMFDNTSLPTNWSIVSTATSSYAERFLKGASSFGTTNGTSTHTHSNLVITSSLPSATTTVKTTTVSGPVNAHPTHTHDVTFSFDTATSLPKYRDVILGKSTILPNLRQNHYRWRNDTIGLNTSSTASWLALEDTAGKIIQQSTTRLRVEIANTGSASAENYQYRLEYAAKNDTCGTFDVVPTTTASAHFVMVDSSQYVDGASTTVSFLTAVNTFATGTAVEYPSNKTAAFSLTNGYYTEFEYAIQATANASTSQTYCFRLTNNSTTTYFTYDIYPQVTVVPTLTQRAYIFENDDGGDVNSNSDMEEANTTTTEVVKGQRLVARFQIDNTGPSTSTKSYKVQYDHNDNKWTNLAFGGSPSSNSGANLGDWNAAIVDDPATLVGFYTSIAIGTDGFPVISYYSFENGGVLKVVKCNDSACTGGGETITIVDDPATISAGSYTSIAIGTDSYPVISYYSAENGGVLKVVKCDDSACAGGGETITIVDDPTGTASAGSYTSIAIGTDGFPVISYESLENGGVLKVVKCNDSACTGGGETITTVDDPANQVGDCTSIAIGTDGYPVISYYDYGDGTCDSTGECALKVAKCNDIACNVTSTITITMVDDSGTNDAGSYTSIAIGTDGFPVISYESLENGGVLKVVKCNDSACTGGGETITIVDDPDAAVGLNTSIAIGTDGYPVISYYDSSAQRLKVAKCNDPACTGGGETITIVDDPVAAAGLYTSIAIGTDSYPVISYYSAENGGVLKVAKMLPIAELQPSWGLSGVNNATLTDSVITPGACATTTCGWQDGRWYETTATSTSISLGASKCTELAFMIDTSEAVASTTYRLRLVYSDDTTLYSYEKYPSLTIVPESQNTKRYSKEAVKTAASSCGAGGASDYDCTTVDDPANWVGYYTSIAIGTDGYPVISYYDASSTALKVTKCNDAACSGQDETITFVDNSAAVGQYTSIAIGTDGYPVISYYDSSAQRLNVAKCNDPACFGGDETITMVDDSGTSDVGRYSSIAIGTDGYPVISYFDYTANRLKVAKCNDPACTGGDETITSVNDLAIPVGLYNSIAIGTDGYPVISYYASSAQRLKVAKCNDPACTGGDETITTIEFPATWDGAYTSIAISTDGYPVISYQGITAYSLKVAKQVSPGTGIGCTGNANWTCTTVDDPANYVGYYTSIAIGTDGYPVISYYDSSAQRLKVAKCNDIACNVTSTITITMVDDSGTSDVGNYTSIAIGTDGYPVISYWDGSAGSLKVTKALGLPKTAISYFNNYIKTDKQIKLTRNLWSSATTSAMWLEASPAIEDGLTYWMDKTGYTAVGTDDSSFDNVTSTGGTSTSSPAFLFTDNHATNTNPLYARWIGQSTTTNAVYLQVFRFGNSSSTTGWFPTASSTSCANQDCTIDGNRTTNLSDYYYPVYNFNDSTGTTTPEFWTFWRVYQSEGSQTLKTDYWKLQYGAFPVAIDISGKVYSGEGSGALSGKTIHRKVNAGGDATTTTDGSGYYIFSGVSCSAGDTITVYIDGDATYKGTTVTVIGSTSIADMDIYASHIIVRDDNTGSGLTIANMVYWDKDDDTDVQFTATTTGTDTLTVDSPNELYVWSTISGKFRPGGNVTTHDLEISSASSTYTAAGTESHTVSGSWKNSGTFTSASSTVTFNSTSTETISGNLNGGNSFWKLQFNGAGGGWTIENPMKVAAASTTDTFLIKQGTVTMGNGANDNLEVLGNLVVGDGTGNATFTTPEIPQASGTITIHINQDSATPATCGACKVIIGSSTGTGAFILHKNNILKFNSAASVQSGLEVGSTGYLWIEGSRDDYGTSTGNTSETVIGDTSKSWSADVHNGKYVRMTSGLAFGKIYEITDTTPTTLVRADNSTSTTVSAVDSGTPVRTATTTSSVITANDQGIGRYLHDTTTNTWYKIVDTVDGGANDRILFIAEPDAFNISATDNITISDGVRSGDGYEILDYAQVTAHADNHGYIYATTSSETLIRYADISELGAWEITGTKSGVSFYNINGASSSEGVTIEKSRIHDGYYGVLFWGSSNNNTANTKGLSNNAAYSNTVGFYLFSSSNNTLTSNNSYGNMYGFYLFSSNNNTLTSNNSYSNTYGFYLDLSSNNNTLSSNNSYSNGYSFSLGSSSNNTLTSNNSYGNMYGFYLFSSNNNTLTSNNSYSNAYGLYTVHSIGTIAINDNYGGLGTNTNGDVYFNDSTSASTIRCYSCDLNSPTSTVGITYAGAYFASFKHDTLATSTKIWGEYTIPDNNTETPQDEGTNKFNFANNLWEDSITDPGYSGTGTKDENLSLAFSAAMAGANSAYAYRATLKTASAQCNGLAGSAVFDVFRDTTDIADVYCGQTYTDSTTTVQFKIDQGATQYIVGDSYTFVAFKKSDNTTDVQKILAIQQADDKITVGSGETLELKGGGGGANQDSQITHTAAGTWDFDVANGTTTVQEATINDMDLTAGTLTVLNTILNNETVISTSVLNVDWYLGVHMVDAFATSTNIANVTTTISENSTTSQATVWKWSGGAGGGWGAPATNQTTVTGADGKISQPGNNGAIRIREYSATSTGATYYKYNLHLDWMDTYGEYDYYNDYGEKYITSVSSTQASGVDKVIDENWQRNDIDVNNTPEPTVNEPPTNGTWVAGMFSGLIFGIDTFSIDFGTIDPGTAPTDQTNVLSVTTSATYGYVITAWARYSGTSAKMTCSATGQCGTETIDDWAGTNATPTSWVAGNYGFGYSTDDVTLSGGTANRFSGPNFAGFLHSGPGDPVGNRGKDECPCNATTTTVTYRLAAEPIQRAGPYQTTVIYILTANY